MMTMVMIDDDDNVYYTLLSQDKGKKMTLGMGRP